MSAGEGAGAGPAALPASFQSAPAECRREKHAAAALKAGPLPFQSAPAECRREKAPARSSRCRVPVSIRSRRMSAGEAEIGGFIGCLEWFQSAPAECRREKPKWASVVQQAQAFQSAPAECRREKHRAQAVRSSATCFNPLPPNVGGRRPFFSDVRHLFDVSIRSRRMSAGEGCHGRAPFTASMFQSAPAECRREKRAGPLESIAVFIVSIRSRRMSAGEGGGDLEANLATAVSIRSRRMSAGEGRRPNSFRQRVLRTAFRVPEPKCPHNQPRQWQRSRKLFEQTSLRESRMFWGFDHSSRSAKGIQAISGPSKSIAVSRPKRSTMPSSRKLACK